jgi:hypothetical protein
VLAHRFDPLSSGSAVRGLLALLRTRSDIALLRTDHSGIGAVAHGAVFATVGTHTICRHLYPPNARNGHTTRADEDLTPRVFVPRLLSWRKGSVLGPIRRDFGIFDCHFLMCDGRSLRRFRQEADSAVERDARLHSLYACRDLMAEVLGEPAVARGAAWARLCAATLNAYQALRRDAGVLLKPAPALRAWSMT